MSDFLILFFVLSIVNVVFSTIKTIITINGNKYVASVLSGAYYPPKTVISNGKSKKIVKK